ncbi:hypothetical protein FPRO04_12592 [Fusarium proliferatum]|nr:hypothetical protein FPRO04_12592 [Fusarium proliferatum]
MASHSAPTMEVQKLLEMLRLDGSKKRTRRQNSDRSTPNRPRKPCLYIQLATQNHWYALKLNRFDRSKFLRRLELDGMWLSEIFCEICQKFHEPRKSRDFTPREARRACVKYGDPKLEEKSFSPYLQDIHFDIIAALSRSRRFRHKATAESDFAAQWYHLEDMVEWTTYYPDDPENPRVRVEQTIYYSGEDHILIKSQGTLFTGESTGRDLLGILNRARTLSRIIHDAPELWAVCPHASWTELYPFLFRPDDEFKWRRGQWSFQHRRSSFGNIAEQIEERGSNKEAFYLPDPYGDERDL